VPTTQPARSTSPSTTAGSHALDQGQPAEVSHHPVMEAVLVEHGLIMSRPASSVMQVGTTKAPPPSGAGPIWAPT
jgi:hypothetical protein